MFIKINNNFKYLVIHSGYTSRLTSQIDEINDSIYTDVYYSDDDGYEKSILYIEDSLWGDGKYSYGDPIKINKVEKIIKDNNLDLCGIIVFECGCLMDALAILKVLTEQYSYCGCFRLEGISEMACYNDELLIMHVDAESG
jgi:hypothetical protein